jgi:N-acetylglutamate synthase-like GNAT family acetyltransferase
MPDELLDSLSVEQREERWRRALGEGVTAMYVAVEDDAVVGFCAVAAPSRDDDAKEGVVEIGAIYVEPSVWRTSAGRALTGRCSRGPSSA